MRCQEVRREALYGDCLIVSKNMLSSIRYSLSCKLKKIIIKSSVKETNYTLEF